MAQNSINWTAVKQGIFISVGSIASIGILTILYWLCFIFPTEWKKNKEDTQQIKTDISQVKEIQLMQGSMVAISFSHVLENAKNKFDLNDSINRMYFNTLRMNYEINKKYIERNPGYQKIIKEMSNNDYKNSNDLLTQLK